jgi:hydroxyacylglutathione hydrolase
MQDFYIHHHADLTIYQTPTLWRTYQNYNYIVCKEDKAIIIDPGDFEPIQKTILKNSLDVRGIILTHHHADHVGATKQLQKNHQCEVMGFSKDRKRLPELTQTYNEGDVFKIAGYDCHILHLPGHTLGLCALYLKELHLLFSNDLIFSLGCGRVFEGSFPQMFESLKKVRELPEETVLFCSHEYTLGNLEFGRGLFPDDPSLLEVDPLIRDKCQKEIPTVPTSLAFEKRYNPFLRWDDSGIRQALDMKDAEDWQVFAKIRELKDLA